MLLQQAINRSFVNRGASVAILLLSFVSSSSHADDVSSARDHYKNGTTAYDLGRFAEAAAEYEKAYEAKQDAALLYNMGQAYRGAGLSAKAITAYKSFLRRVPNASNRGEVEARVAEMQRQMAEQATTSNRPPLGTLPADATLVKTPQETPAPQPREQLRTQEHQKTEESQRPERVLHARRERIAGLVLGSVGLASLIVGGVFVALAKSANDSITSSGVFDSSAQAQRNSFQTADIACFAIGGAALAAGLTVFLVGRAHRQNFAVLPTVGSRFAGISLSAKF